MTVTVPVLAENEHNFNEYIEFHHLDPSHFSYIDGYRGFNGLRNWKGAIITIGKWWRNPAYQDEEFKDALKGHSIARNISLIPATWDFDGNINNL